MPSYTDMATRAPAALPPQEVLTDPVLAEKWFLSLPPRAQDLLKQRLTRIVQSLPPVLQLELRRNIAQGGHANPVPSTIDGMGHFHTVSVRGQEFATSQELGQWGALVGSLIGAGMQVGGSLYTARQEQRLTRDLQSNALATDATLQQAAINAQRETQMALIAAQTQAAQIAGGASVARAQINAPAVATALKWGGISVGVAVVGIGAYFVLRRKKK
jgi:hypothetical protein